MEFGEVLDALFDGSLTLTGYDANIILLKEIEKVISGGCKTDLILDVAEVDEQWILNSDDEVNILICVDWGPAAIDVVKSGVVDLCKFFKGGVVANTPGGSKITIGVMAAAPEHGSIFFNHFSETYSGAEWEGYAPSQLKDFQEKYFMFVVLGSKVGFFCLNWTHPQLKQVIKEVI